MREAFLRGQVERIVIGASSPIEGAINRIIEELLLCIMFILLLLSEVSLPACHITAGLAPPLKVGAVVTPALEI